MKGKRMKGKRTEPILPPAVKPGPVPYVVPGVFSPAECAEIRAYACSSSREHNGSVGYGGRTVQHDMRRSQVRWLDPTDPAMRTVSDRLNRHLLKANIGGAGFGLPFHGFPDLQFTTYASWEQGHYDWHRDDSPGSTAKWERLLSVVVLLSQPAEFAGGALEFECVPDTQLAQGTLVVFPSSLRHRVTPVTAGVRHSLVAWAYGERMKDEG